MARIIGIVLALCVSGCAAYPGAGCPTGQSPMIQAELFFGRSLPSGGEVSEADWLRFVDEEVTPRFPDGLTVEDAWGQWKGASGIVRERAKHLLILLPGGDTAKLDTVRAAYKSRFHQESVLLVTNRVCGGF